MVRLSFFAASALVSLVAGQIDTQSLISPSGQPAQAPEPGCGGCYVGADIAGIVFGGVETQTITQITSVVTGPNGTIISTAVTTATPTVTNRISTPVTTNMFSFSPDGIISPSAPVATRYNLLDSTINVGGAILTSPTQYEVFTAYSITSFTAGDDGQCTPVPGSRSVLSPAFQVEVPDGAMGDFLTSAENSFIDFLAVTCMAGGGNVASTVQSMIEETTTESATTGPTRISPIRATTSADTPSMTPTPTPTPTPTANVTVSTGMPIAPSFTDVTPSIMPGAGSAVAPGVLSAVAAFGIGLAAMFL